MSLSRAFVVTSPSGMPTGSQSDPRTAQAGSFTREAAQRDPGRRGRVVPCGLDPVAARFFLAIARPSRRREWRRPRRRTGPARGDRRWRKGQKAAEKQTKGISEFELDTSEVRVRAENQGGDAAHYEFRGFVDLVAGPTRIQSDTLDLYTTDKPDGTKTRRIVADGNVVFMKDEERLSGSHLDMDLDTGKGFFEDAIGYIEPGVFVEGKRIERLAEKLYRVEGGKFTVLRPAQPALGHQRQLGHHRGGREDHRPERPLQDQVGPRLLLPDPLLPHRRGRPLHRVPHPPRGHSSSVRGFNIGEGFFWAMSRSADMTFYGDYYSKYGYGFGHEFRYAAVSPVARDLPDLSLLALRSEGDRDYDLDWNARQSFPGELRASLNVRRYSSLSFNQRFNDSFNYASHAQPARPPSTCSGRSAPPPSSSWPTASTPTSARTPSGSTAACPRFQIRQAPQKIGKTGVVLNYEARAERLTLGTQDLVQDYSRFDLAPELSRPLQVSFLQLNPRLGLRYTALDAPPTRGDGTFSGPRPGTAAGGGQPGDARPDLLAGLRPSGRRLHEPDQARHRAGGELHLGTPVDDFLSIPKFDGNDYLLGTNQVRYALVQRLWPSGRAPRASSSPTSSSPGASSRPTT